MDKEKIQDLIKKTAHEREKAKEKFYQLDGMVLAYEYILREMESSGT